MGTDLNRELSTNKSQMAERHLRKCSIPLAIREMQIKTILKFCFTPARMAKKTLMLEKMWGKRYTPPVLVSASLYSCFGNQYGDFSENYETIYLKTSNTTFGYISKSLTHCWALKLWPLITAILRTKTTNNNKNESLPGLSERMITKG